MVSAQARYWIGTIPSSTGWNVPTELPDGVNWIRGQEELGEGGLRHHQVFVAFSRARRLAHVRSLLPGHWEPTRSRAAEDYVWKEDTRIADTQFELGSRPFKRNDPTDWKKVREAAQSGDLTEVPDDVYCRYYGTLQRIAADHAKPRAMLRSCEVFWGATGTGKSRRAWSEAGLEAYSKAPLSKWWCGYRGEEHVVIDEFVGVLSISHLLRWLDRYPVRVEVKGGSLPLRACRYWITSNINPGNWYPDATLEQKAALLRRMNITHFP